MKSFTYLVSLLLLLVAINGCGAGGSSASLDGTLTDNPTEPPIDAEISEGTPEIPHTGENASFALRLSISLCSKIIECAPRAIDADACIEDVMSIPNMELALGLPAGRFGNLAGAGRAENAGFIRRSTQAPRCLSDIADLSCQSVDVNHLDTLLVGIDTCHVSLNQYFAVKEDEHCNPAPGENSCNIENPHAQPPVSEDPNSIDNQLSSPYDTF